MLMFLLLQIPELEKNEEACVRVRAALEVVGLSR